MKRLMIHIVSILGDRRRVKPESTGIRVNCSASAILAINEIERTPRGILAKFPIRSFMAA